MAKRKTHCKAGHEFNEDNTGHNGKGFRYCKPCNRRNAQTQYWKDPERAKQWHKLNYQERRDNVLAYKRQYRADRRHITARYNLSVAFTELLAAQGNVCKSCKRPDQEWMVDHDHSCCPGIRGSCGYCVRGIICRHCNTVLGFVKDSVDHLLNLIDYLMEYENRKQELVH